MRPVDVERVFEIQQECKLSFWTVAGHLEELRRTDSVSLVAELENQILGFLTARFLPAVSDKNDAPVSAEAEILNFGIAETFQQQGIGTLLFNGFLLTARAAQIQSIWLEVRASNQNALGFYQSRGFVEIQRRRNFYALPAEDAVVMKLTLPEASTVSDANFS